MIQILIDDSSELITDLEKLAEQMIQSGDPKPEQFEKFGQMIDRIMGAATTLGLPVIGDISNMGKSLGYKLSQSDNPKLLNIAAPILLDLALTLKGQLDYLGENGNEPPADEALNERLEWLDSKLVGITRASCT